MPIKGLTEQRRLPRVGKIHLGIKAVNSKGIEYPLATDYFVLPDGDSPGSEHREELIDIFGEKPKELRIVFPLEEEDAIASQYYRYYTKTRGLVCRGDGEICTRIVDIDTGDVPSPKTTSTEMKEMNCGGRTCPDYQAGKCREMMHLQFMLPEVSGLGVWQIDTSSINSIRNINSNIQLLKAIYGRISMVPLLLSLEKKEVIPPGDKKKTIHVLDIRHSDNMINALIKSRKPPLELLLGPADLEQAEKDIEDYWPSEEKERMLSQEEASTRLTPAEIKELEKTENESVDQTTKNVTETGKSVDNTVKNVTRSRTNVNRGGGEKASIRPEDGEKGVEQVRGRGSGDKVKRGGETTAQNTFSPSEVNPSQKKSPGVPAEDFIAGPEFVIPIDWLNEAKKALNWPDDTLLSFLASDPYKVTGKSVAEALSKLTREKAEKFTRAINDKVESVQPGLPF